MLFNFLIDLVIVPTSFLSTFINIPHLNAELLNNIIIFIDMLFSNTTLLSFFVRPATVKVALPIVIQLLNIEWTYALVMWLLKKVPFINMK